MKKITVYVAQKGVECKSNSWKRVGAPVECSPALAARFIELGYVTKNAPAQKKTATETPEPTTPEPTI